ncbi:hypothetical protein KAI87_04270, partial [Myxococcota bacterium]|nr:hypothetical protein [Myxococcota bacterium]
LEDAVWCDGGSQSCINNEDCPTDESCIRTNAGDPDGVCIPRCTDPQTPCGTGESIDEYCLELELQQGGVETVCALCNPLCGDYQQCIGIGGQHPLSGAYLSCGCASDNLCAADEWCDTIDGYCKTGYKTCNYASPECPSDQFCNFAIGHCESSCTDDNHCSTLGWGGSLCVAGDANYSYNRCLPGCNPVGSTSSSDSCATVQSSDGANYINVWVPCHQECTDGNQCVATTVNAQDVESVAPYCECSTTNQSCPSGMYCETTGNYCAF